MIRASSASTSSKLKDIDLHRVFDDTPMQDDTGTIYYSLQSKWKLASTRPKKKVRNADEDLQKRIRDFSIKFRKSPFYKGQLLSQSAAKNGGK